MGWTLTADVGEYLAAAGGYLEADPVRHNVELAAAQTLLARGPSAFGVCPPVLGWYRPSRPDTVGAATTGPITAAMFHTPPYPLLLAAASGAPGQTAEPEAARAAHALAAELTARRHAVSAVNSDAGLAAVFAAAWRRHAGATATVYLRSRLFRLGELVPPHPPPGAARLATTADTALLTRWMSDFLAETGVGGEDPAAAVADRLGYSGLTVWEIAQDGGTPVAVAGHARPAAGVIRVGPVFTPRGRRGRGYGGAATAAVSRAAQASGAQAVLFTDLANPTSNALYERLGYRRVADRLVLRLDSATPDAPA